MNLESTIRIIEAQHKPDFKTVKKLYKGRDPWTGDETRSKLGNRETEHDPQWKNVKAKGKRVTVKRINNPAAFGGPELYKTDDPSGGEDREFRDYAGAEIRKRKLDRKRFKLGKGYKALRTVERLKYGKIIPQDERLRPTTAGSGGLGQGPGNG